MPLALSPAVLPRLLLVAAALFPGCRAGAPREAVSAQSLPPATAEPLARVRAWEGPRALEAPLFPQMQAEDSLAGSMREAWGAAGENPALFELRFGERIFSTKASFDVVREFYLSYVSQVFMDHEMDFPDLGSQRMFTGLVPARDGSLVKLTLTQPFYPYPSTQAIRRTFLQMGRAGVWNIAGQASTGGSP